MDISRWSVAILAGGMATRLMPLTTNIPKALVEINSRPFIFHQIDLLKKSGLREIVLCTGHLEQQIRKAVTDGSRFGVRIQYSSDGDKLLGTGGAVQKALPLLSDPFFVLYGDSYLPIDYHRPAEAFQKAATPALMTVYANQNRFDRSNVWFEKGWIKAYSKKNVTAQMKYIDYGLNILTHKVFRSAAPSEKEDLADILESLSAAGQLAGFEVDQRFYEIGSPQGIQELEVFLKNKK